MHPLSAFGLILQTAEGQGMQHAHWTALMVFAGIVTAAFVAQACVLIAFAYAGMKTRRELMEIVRAIHSKAMPLIDNAAETFEEISPKLKTASQNVVEISETVRQQTVKIDALVTDARNRAQRQTIRVDSMVTDTIGAVGHMTASVQHAILTPIKQIGGMIAGIKNAAEKFSQRAAAATGSSHSSRSAYDMRQGEERFGEGEDYHA